MSDLEIIQIPLLVDNYAYLLIDHETGTTAVVDPSTATPVLDVLKQRNIPLHYILNTHHHHDHVGGNLELKKATKCEIICSHTDKSRIPGADKVVEEGDEVLIGNTIATVMEIPGHTVGHIAYYFAGEKAVFCGDTLFSLGCGRLFEGTPEQMWNSLRRLADLPRATRIFCGHEYTQANGQFALSLDPHNRALQDYCHHVADQRLQNLPTIPSTVEIEVEANPFLRAPLLIGALNLPSDIPPHLAFAEMRHRKDHFTE